MLAMRIEDLSLDRQHTHKSLGDRGHRGDRDRWICVLQVQGEILSQNTRWSVIEEGDTDL